jgi:hypothetical protein
VWGEGEKKMNLEWDAHGRIELVSFRSGDWEEKLLRALLGDTTTPEDTSAAIGNASATLLLDRHPIIW